MNSVTKMHRKQTNDKARDKQTLTVADGSQPVDREPPLSPADHLFAELDHRRVGEGPASWLTEVAAIHMVRHEAWVQLALVGESSRSVILHLAACVTAKHALATLAASWSRTADDAAPEVIHVLQLA